MTLTCKFILGEQAAKYLDRHFAQKLLHRHTHYRYTSDQWLLYNNNNNDRLTAFDPGQPG